MQPDNDSCLIFMISNKRYNTQQLEDYKLNLTDIPDIFVGFINS